MILDAMADELAVELGEFCVDRRIVLSAAESCTGGMVAAAITSVAGASKWFDRGFVTYSNEAKTELLGVSPQTLETFGAVSEETAREMALGALSNSFSNVAFSVTGIAGPDGGTDDKPVGTVCFGFAFDGKVVTATRRFRGNRDSVRQQSVHHVLASLLTMAQRPVATQ
ncbi:MAG: CinA family protein [Betaproteobacteria bacterium]|nr:MAG: CinA family protein [Betaproteobacteria bacterium]